MLRLVSCALLSLTLLVGGCGPILDVLLPPDGGLPGTLDPTGSPELKAFESEEELRAYFSREIDTRNEYLGFLLRRERARRRPPDR